MLLTTKYYQQKLSKLNHITIDKDCIHFIKQPEVFHQELINLILSSKERIYITALYLQDDECGREILNLIFEHAKNTPSLKFLSLALWERRAI